MTKTEERICNQLDADDCPPVFIVIVLLMLLIQLPAEAAREVLRRWLVDR